MAPRHLEAALARRVLSFIQKADPSPRIAVSELRYLQIPFFGFDDQEHTGELLVHQSVAEEVEEILEDLNRLFELDMDKKFERVDYLETEKVYVCTFKDMKKFFLKRSDILDNVNSEIKQIIIDKLGYHFTVKYV